jgi:hypothetical protein
LAENPHLKEDSVMAELTTDELVEIAPEAVALVKEITEALKADGDGKVRVTKAEARAIRKLAFALAVKVAHEALD